jgi:hypothetical protein
MLASSTKATALLGWRSSDADTTIRRSVQWHLARPPQTPDLGFDADETALTAAER